MYMSYNGDDLGRQSLHLRPSTVEENQASGVITLTQKERKDSVKEALNEFSVWRPKKRQKEDESAD